MKLTEIKIKDEKGANVKFSQDELMDIALFVHDKSHTRKRYRDRLPSIEKALKNFSTSAPDLYRGIYPEEAKGLEVGATFSPRGYMSMSEKPDIAMGFSGYTNIMLHAKGLHAFPYWKFRRDHLLLPQQKKDPEAFVNNDGDYDLKSNEKEAEWLVGHDTKFKIINKRQDDNLTIFDIEEA